MRRTAPARLVPGRPVPGRLLWVSAACSALLLTAACGSSDAPSAGQVPAPSPSSSAPTVAPTLGSDPTTAPTAGQTSAPQAEQQGPPETSASPAGKTITIAYAGGKATGDTGRIKVKVGELVTLEFTSDVETQVHIHGADLELAAAPGIQLVQQFTEDAPGIYEIELHDGGGVLTRVQAE